jgi:hypothetical protein
MTVYLSEHDAARLGIDGAKPRTTRGRGTRPELPAAGRAAATGLSTFLKAGWNWTYCVGSGYKLERGALSSGWHASEKAACDAAKELAR